MVGSDFIRLFILSMHDLEACKSQKCIEVHTYRLAVLSLAYIKYIFGILMFCQMFVNIERAGYQSQQDEEIITSD